MFKTCHNKWYNLHVYSMSVIYVDMRHLLGDVVSRFENEYQIGSAYVVDQWMWYKIFSQESN